MSEVAMSFRERIIQLRALRPLREVALAVGVSASAISQWERGVEFPSDHHLAKLAQVYSVDFSELKTLRDQSRNRESRKQGGVKGILQLVERLRESGVTSLTALDVEVMCKALHKARAQKE